MHSTVGIVGAGNLGRALHATLKKKGVRVQMWDENPSRSPRGATLENTVTGTDFLFFCIPTLPLRKALRAAMPYLERNTIVISLAKGMEKDGSTAPEILAATLPKGQPFAFMGGPMLAKEISRGEGAVGVASSHHAQVRQKIVELFAGTSIMIECTTTPRVTAFCGVFKNIYATALGITEGLGWKSNRKGWLAAKSIEEMATVFPEFGIPSSAAFTTAGLGDFLATGFSSHSMNHRAGKELIQTGKCTIRSEGICALPVALALLGNKTNRYPLLSTIERVMLRGSDPEAEFEKFFHHI